ncbi:MAG: hypothetical protein QOG93_1769 [Gaiellaceae bacterium]|nr:hypothetical protein [Gaiellaceae bacterium]
MNVLGCAVRAIAPATSAPSANPTFIVILCCAKAACRRAGGVSELRSVDWLGQNDPVATPTSRFSANACQVSRISGKSEKATAARASAPLSTTRGPNRSESAPPTKPEAKAASEPVATTSPAIPSEMPRTLCR